MNSTRSFFGVRSPGHTPLPENLRDIFMPHPAVKIPLDTPPLPSYNTTLLLLADHTSYRTIRSHWGGSYGKFTGYLQ